MKISWKSGETGYFTVDGVKLESRAYGPPPDASSTIVLLHEGLGSALLWGDFPEKLAQETGLGVFAYSRQGYGASDPAPLPRPLDYMTREATEVLPAVLDSLALRHGILLGHSDGASIAALYLGCTEDHRIEGLVLMAPHFFTESEGLKSIAAARKGFVDGDLRSRLAKHHKNVDNTFFGWNDAWLNPDFENWDITDSIDHIRVPVLVIQGQKDHYGSLAQVEVLDERLYSPFERVLLDGCRHSPFIEKPRETLGAVKRFVERVERLRSAEVATR